MQVCDYFDDEYGDQPDLTLGSLHETDSNYTGTPATDIMPIFPSSSSPIRFEDNNTDDYCRASEDFENKCELANARKVLTKFHVFSRKSHVL